ncbi:MAG: hypothetical protein HQM16_11420 [Deltaproteobacteria bacterium]|nr:hypothetical protein [Deltaproteobacteria bacterium]
MKQYFLDKEIEFNKTDNGFHIRFDDQSFDIDVTKIDDHTYSLIHQGEGFTVYAAEDAANTYFHIRGEIHTFPKKTESQGAVSIDEETAGEQSITAPMPGKIVKVFVKAGEKVIKGDKVIIVEAMKMEHEILAKLDGTVKEINIKDGDLVDALKVLVKIVA